VHWCSTQALNKTNYTRTTIAANLLQKKNMIESNSATEVDGTWERARTHRVRSKTDVEHRVLIFFDEQKERERKSQIPI